MEDNSILKDLYFLDEYLTKEIEVEKNNFEIKSSKDEKSKIALLYKCLQKLRRSSKTKDTRIYYLNKKIKELEEEYEKLKNYHEIVVLNNLLLITDNSVLPQNLEDKNYQKDNSL